MVVRLAPYVKLVHIIIKVVSLNPRGEMHWIQHYMIKFVNEVWQFILGTLDSLTNNTFCHNIHVALILLNVVLDILNSINGFMVISIIK